MSREILVDLLAEVVDLQALLGRTLDGDELVRGVALLQAATGLVYDEIGYDKWVDQTTGRISRDQVPWSIRHIVARAAERAMRNPGGYSSESSGDYTYQRTGVAAEGVYFTESEWRTIRRRSSSRTGLWTQPTTRGEEWPRTVYLEDSNGCELFPVDTYWD
jgi:hypothetical protein